MSSGPSELHITESSLTKRSRGLLLTGISEASLCSQPKGICPPFQNSGLAEIPKSSGWSPFLGTSGGGGSVILHPLLFARFSLELKCLQFSHGGKGPVHPQHLSEHINTRRKKEVWNCAFEPFCLTCPGWWRMITTLTTIRTVFMRRGMEKTKDMNIPLESKYWKLEKDLQGEM